MRTNVVVLGALCAATLSVACGRARTEQRQEPARAARPDRERLTEREDADTIKTSGLHRASSNELAVIDRWAKIESAKVERQRLERKRLGSKAVSVPALSWVSLGPTSSFKEQNGLDLVGVTSGRPSSIVVDPRDPNVVYIALIGGGVWKTFDFLSADGPTWAPMTDALPNLAIGALAMDPADPHTLYLGTGDFHDKTGHTIQKTTDGGATWSDPVVLAGTYPAPSSSDAAVTSVRRIGVDGSLVLAGTDGGLFTSTDGGATFALTDLPNIHDKILTDSIWSVVSTGKGQWALSGVTSCDEVADPVGGLGTTKANAGTSGKDPGATCPEGNNAEIWHSVDGKTWTRSTLPADHGTGRVTLAAGPTADPAKTVLYAYVASTNGRKTLAFWRSDDGGRTFEDATGTVTAPTKEYDDGSGTLVRDCGDTNVSHGQGYYDQAIVVDPTNADHVVVGGNLCAMRTLNGTSDAPSWEVIAHWLGDPDTGANAAGPLPYVHADWQTATAAIVDGKVRTFAGTDGGIFSSTNLFDDKIAPEAVVWTNHNTGLATHLMYSVASGDPASGNPFVLFSGLQDNGTRFRADPKAPSVFNQPIGGDGIGAAVHVATSGTTYWGSVEFAHAYCEPKPDPDPKKNIDCSDGADWWEAEPSFTWVHDMEEREERRSAYAEIHGEDNQPFFVRYANVETDPDGQSVLTASLERVYVAQPHVPTTPDDAHFEWKALSQDTSRPGAPTGNLHNVTASRTIAGLYGAVNNNSLAPFFVTASGNTMSTWTEAKPVQPLGPTGPRLRGPASMDFPPVTPVGKEPGDVYIGVFSATMSDVFQSPPPDDQGRAYRTTDRGQTWTSVVGADPAHRLPNVPTYVVKYDPVTPTTIYVGNDLGVYISKDDGATWDRFGEGFPIVTVRDIYVAKNQDFIRVATWGRGLWEIYPSAAANHGAPGNGDYDRNQRLDWVDLAAMSSRLGVTPARNVQPLYSWIMDMTGGGDAPVQSIDDADLSALLAKLGGHP
jgi:hypothetical protein